MNEPTYGGLTASQLWQAINEAGAADMVIKPLVLEDLLRELEDKNTIEFEIGIKDALKLMKSLDAKRSQEGVE
jgi:hypothetical protein